VVACSVVRPEGINGMAPKSVKKKLKQPSFAAAVNREDIRVGAEELGIDQDALISTVIAALQSQADALELNGSAPTGA
jgi:predicted hydrolase (HD superfamily)